LHVFERLVQRRLPAGQKNSASGSPESILIGEDATKLLRDNEAFVAQHPEVPWRSIKRMRNRIAHGYFEINLETVWETVQSALPDRLNQLLAIRDSLK